MVILPKINLQSDKSNCVLAKKDPTMNLTHYKAQNETDQTFLYKACDAGTVFTYQLKA